MITAKETRALSDRVRQQIIANEILVIENAITNLSNMGRVCLYICYSDYDRYVISNRQNKYSTTSDIQITFRESIMAFEKYGFIIEKITSGYVIKW